MDRSPLRLSSASMGAAAGLAGEYDAVMGEVIGFARSCSDADWQAICPNEQRSVGVLFDHIAQGNSEVVRWVQQFLDDRPVEITPEILNARNAAHAHRVAPRPRAETITNLVASTGRTSDFIHGLTDDHLQSSQDFDWAGPQDVAWVASAAFRHPRGHLKSIREALGR